MHERYGLKKSDYFSEKCLKATLTQNQKNKLADFWHVVDTHWRDIEKCSPGALRQMFDACLLAEVYIDGGQPVRVADYLNYINPTNQL